MAGYQFEWDAPKARESQRRHGVTFDEAITAFSDPLAMLLPDPDHSIAEQRYLVLGTSTQGRLAGGSRRRAATTDPPDLRTAGYAKERRQYEEKG
jgi:uncharacterized DUF497 family protein